MPVVNMPNGDAVNFPDSMPKEQIKSLIMQKFPDLGKSTAPTQQAPQPQQALGSQLLQGAAGAVNKAQEVVSPIISKAVNAIPGLESYKAATRPAAEAVTRGLGAAESAISKSNVPGLNEYRKAVDTVRQGMLNPEQTKNPETTRNIAAAWDLIKAAGGVKAIADMGILGAKGGIAGAQLATQGVKAAGKAGLEAVAPEYAAKVAEAKRVASLPESDILNERRTNLYKEAAQKGATYSPKLNESLMNKIQESLPKEYSTGAGLTPEQELEYKPLQDYLDRFKNKPITSLEGVRGLERELNQKIAANINPATHKVNPTGQVYLDIRQHLHDLYTNPNKGMVQGSPEGINALLKANKAYSKEIKQRQIEDVIDLSNGDKNAERAGFRALYKRARKSNFWNDQELEGLRQLYKKPNLLQNAAKTAIAHKTMGLSKLLPSGETDISGLQGIISKGE